MGSFDAVGADLFNLFTRMFLYSLALVAALILASPYWLLRMIWSGRYRDGLAQRLGAVPQALRMFVGRRRTLWIHAVSVGETLAIGRLVELLDALDPDLPVVISTTTRTGQKLAQERFRTARPGQTRVFYYPLDFAWIVRRYLRVLRPRAIILVESELWPRLLVEAHRAKIPVIVVNGRISDRSLPRYRALNRLWRPFLRRLTLVLAQSEQDRQRFVEIGVPAEIVRTMGNLKFDVRAVSKSVLATELRAHLPNGAKVLVAGSTLEGEELYILKTMRELLPKCPDLVVILAPRHPERFQAVAELVREQNFTCIRRSEWMVHPKPLAVGTVFLLDSIGELASIYALSSVAFVGGSLVPAGGHNPLEPAQFAVPIVMGPYTENFRGIVGVLLDREAIRVTPPERFQHVLEELLASPPNTSASSMGARAREVFQEYAGASEQCFAAVREILIQGEPSSHLVQDAQKNKEMT